MGCQQSKSATDTGGPTNGEVQGRPSQRRSLIEVKDRIDCSKETVHTTLGGAKVRYAYFSQRGYYPDDETKANQDSYCVHQDFGGTENDAFLAVFDGHGRFGDKCSQFARDRLPGLVERYVQQTPRGRSAAERRSKPEKKKISDLSAAEYEAACKSAHLECNRMMHATNDFDDTLSGTTAISMTFHGQSQITVCNVGDSRAIMGQRVSSNNGEAQKAGSSIYRAMALSLDQTPYRKDERRRVKLAGARILSLDQIEGLEPVDDESVESDNLQLGETIDEGGDPPRVWSPDGEYPGTAFTRSIGDVIAEEFGVYAEPEMVTRQLLPEDRIIVLASDGVFEFLTNQSVIDICAKFDDPLEACRAVVAESYELWLQYELRTDDITMICIFVDDIDAPPPERPPEAASAAPVSDRNMGSCKNINEALPPGEVRPVRVAASKNKIEQIKKMQSAMKVESDDDQIDIKKMMTEKSDDDKARIAEAIKASVIFKDVSEKQREMIYGVMEHVSVEAGHWVIKQGELGDYFYIVEEGKFEVRIVPQDATDEEGNGGNLVHLYVGSKATNAHPSFGELALMYSAPRAASIIAQTDGQLWRLHRVVFKRVLSEYNTRREIRQKLRKLRAFKTLTADEVQKLVDSMEEVSYQQGDVLVQQGESGDMFYFIVSGTCQRTRKRSANEAEEKDNQESVTTDLKENDFFGEPMLWRRGTYGGTVIATSPTKCLRLKLASVEQLTGSLLERSGRA